jgi:hypothetical protein
MITSEIQKSPSQFVRNHDFEWLVTETCKKSEKRTKKRLTFAGEKGKMKPIKQRCCETANATHSTFFYELLQGNLHENKIDSKKENEYYGSKYPRSVRFLGVQ